MTHVSCRTGRLLAVLAVALLLTVGCGGSSGDGSTPTGPDNGGGALTAAETAAIDAAVESVVTSVMNQVMASFGSRAVVQVPIALDVIPGSWQGSAPCPAGGNFSGGGSGTFNDDTGAVRGQGSASSNECLVAGGQINITGSIMVQISGNCPGAVTGNITGNVSVYRRGEGGGWVLIQNAYGILGSVSIGC